MNCLRITGSCLKNFRGIFIKFYKENWKYFPSIDQQFSMFHYSEFCHIIIPPISRIENKTKYSSSIFIRKNIQKFPADFIFISGHWIARKQGIFIGNFVSNAWGRPSNKWRAFSRLFDLFQNTANSCTFNMDLNKSLDPPSPRATPAFSRQFYASLQQNESQKNTWQPVFEFNFNPSTGKKSNPRNDSSIFHSSPVQEQSNPTNPPKSHRKSNASPKKPSTRSSKNFNQNLPDSPKFLQKKLDSPGWLKGW